MASKCTITHSLAGTADREKSSLVPATLSATELRICFPARIDITAQDAGSIILQDAPVLGVLTELSELWMDVQKGVQVATATDFYGEYELVLRRQSENVEFTSSWTGESLLVHPEVLKEAVKNWCPEVRRDIEQHYPDIVRNPKYRDLWTFLTGVWMAEAGKG